jgi:hypothetical protein
MAITAAHSAAEIFAATPEIFLTGFHGRRRASGEARIPKGHPKGWPVGKIGNLRAAILPP